MFLLAICTAVFYGVLLWTIYVALEPFVRRYWPQTLVSWTLVLTGHIRDRVVGRDILFGVALGLAWVLLIRGGDLLGGQELAGFPGAMEALDGLRATVGLVLMQGLYAIRNALLFFFLLFLLRAALRNQWAAALAFTGIFVLLEMIGSDRPWLDGVQTLLYMGGVAVAVLRRGLLSLAVGMFVTNVVLVAPLTRDLTAWYFGNMMLLVAIPVALASWALYASLVGRRWKMEVGR